MKNKLEIVAIICMIIGLIWGWINVLSVGNFWSLTRFQEMQAFGWAYIPCGIGLLLHLFAVVKDE